MLAENGLVEDIYMSYLIVSHKDLDADLLRLRN